MNSSGSFIDGGIYVSAFLGLEPGKAHWGLYHHYESQWIKRKDGQVMYVPRGHKYHITGLQSGTFLPAHGQTSGVLTSMSLIGLMLIGIVPTQYSASLDTEIRSFDDLVSTTPGINCQSWVLDTVQRLTDQGFLRTSSTRQQIQNEIQQFIDRNWNSASEAQKPRPIDRSRLFDFDN